jgi:hypothetical protein
MEKKQRFNRLIPYIVDEDGNKMVFDHAIKKLIPLSEMDEERFFTSETLRHDKITTMKRTLSGKGKKKGNN